jgi:alpha-soluble NSF attachment protein
VQALSDQLEAQDVEEFTKEVQTYDAVSRLDQWYTTMLLRIKKQIPDEGELC